MMEEYKRLGPYEAAEFIKGTRSALVLCHTNPDGDAIGSAEALCGVIRALGGTAKIASPSAVPERLEFLAAGEDTSYVRGDEDRYDRLISIDVASRNQLGDLAHLADKVDLMIDHHASGDAFADNIVIPEASAAGEIVFEIYKMLVSSGDIPTDVGVCRAAFGAISSDTGSFKYSNTTPKTFRLAAELTEIINGANDGGLSICDISRLLHDTLSEKDLRINAAVAERIRLYEDGALAVFAIDADDMASLGVTEADLGGASDIVRTLRGVLVALTLRQRDGEERSFKLSSRANAEIDVAAVCRNFGGGGHVRAAGASVKAASLEDALDAVVPAFSEAIRKYRGESAT